MNRRTLLVTTLLATVCLANRGCQTAPRIGEVGVDTFAILTLTFET